MAGAALNIYNCKTTASRQSTDAMSAMRQSYKNVKVFSVKCQSPARKRRQLAGEERRVEELNLQWNPCFIFGFLCAVPAFTFS